MVFESPSAFSIFLKRLINPSRKADDGWKTVKYNGRFLEQFKLELARRRFGGQEEGGSDAVATRTMPRPRVPTLKSLESGEMSQQLSHGIFVTLLMCLSVGLLPGLTLSADSGTDLCSRVRDYC